MKKLIGTTGLLLSLLSVSAFAKTIDVKILPANASNVKISNFEMKEFHFAGQDGSELIPVIEVKYELPDRSSAGKDNSSSQKIIKKVEFKVKNVELSDDVIETISEKRSWFSSSTKYVKLAKKLFHFTKRKVKTGTLISLKTK